MDYGARPLRRAIERYVEDPMAEEVLRLGEGFKIAMDVTFEGDDIEKGEALTFKLSDKQPEQPEKKPEPAAATTE